MGFSYKIGCLQREYAVVVRHITAALGFEINQMKSITIIFLWWFFLFSLCYSNENDKMLENGSSTDTNQIITKQDNTNKEIIQKENGFQHDSIDTMAYKQPRNRHQSIIIVGVIFGTLVTLVVIGLLIIKQSFDNMKPIDIM